MSCKPRPAPISAWILLSTVLAVSGCVSGPPIVSGPSAGCSSLVGDDLKADVAGVDLPSPDASAGDLWGAFDGQTGRLDTANGYKRAGFQTIERCEARDRAAAARISAPWWKRPFLKPPEPG